MGIGFYTALAGSYASDYGAEDDSPEQKSKITIYDNYTNIVGYMLNCGFESSLFIGSLFYLHHLHKNEDIKKPWHKPRFFVRFGKRINV